MVGAPSWSCDVIVMTNFCKSNLKEPVKTELLLSDELSNKVRTKAMLLRKLRNIF